MCANLRSDVSLQGTLSNPSKFSFFEWIDSCTEMVLSSIGVLKLLEGKIDGWREQGMFFVAVFSYVPAVVNETVRNTYVLLLYV